MSHRVDRLLREARESLPDPRDAATRRARDAVVQGVARRAGGRAPRGSLRLAVALTVAGGLALAAGIGIGRSLAPAGAAPSAPSLAPSFRAAAGWTVVPGAVAGTGDVRTAIAANVPLRGEARLELVPHAALATLPSHGIVIAVSTRPRAAAPTPAVAPVRLRLDQAQRGTVWAGPAGAERPLAEYRASGAAGGAAVEARVFFGTATPSRRLLGAAQAQLDRLVVRVASAWVTLVARPRAVRWGERVSLFGSVSGGSAGERVMVEFRDCGQPDFRAYDGALTVAGGGWSSQTGLAISGTLRARWGEVRSAPVRVRVRPGVILERRGSRFKVSVVAARSFWRKRLVFQRFDRRRQRWVTVRRIVLTQSQAAGVMSWSTARFRSRLARGTLVRAVLPAAQARPCYLPAYSNPVRT